MPVLDLDYDVTRNDTALYLDADGLWKRGAINYPQATNDIDDLGFYFKASWIPKPLTNLFRDSEPASDPGQGTRSNVTFGACDWDLGFNTALDGMVTFGDNSVQRDYINSDSVGPGDYTIGVLVKPDDGNIFSVGSGSGNLFQFRGETGFGIISTVIELSDGYFLAYCPHNVATSATFGLRKNTSNNAIGFEVSAIMVVAGTVTWETAEDFLLDYIRTTGSSVARADTDIRKTDFPMLASLCGYIDVELIPSGNNETILSIGADNNNRFYIRQRTNSFIDFYYRVGASNIWQIAEIASRPAGRYRIGFYLSNGLNIGWVNGVESGRNTEAYSPQGNIAVIGGDITGSSNKLVDGGFISEFVATGLTEAELDAIASDYSMYGGFDAFKRVSP